eukprot:4065247-Amphidinium_carterae.1
MAYEQRCCSILRNINKLRINDDTPSSICNKMSRLEKYRWHSISRLLTSFGLDLLAGWLSGPEVDRVTLQLVG